MQAFTKAHIGLAAVTTHTDLPEAELNGKVTYSFIELTWLNTNFDILSTGFEMKVRKHTRKKVKRGEKNEWDPCL